MYITLGLFKTTGAILFQNYQPVASDFSLRFRSVTKTKEGTYECLLKGSDMEIVRRFDVIVDGETLSSSYEHF